MNTLLVCILFDLLFVCRSYRWVQRINCIRQTYGPDTSISKVNLLLNIFDHRKTFIPPKRHLLCLMTQHTLETSVKLLNESFFRAQIIDPILKLQCKQVARQVLKYALKEGSSELFQQSIAYLCRKLSYRLSYQLST